MNDLFPVETSLSPRLRWIAAQKILTHHAPHCPEAPWMAIQPFDKDNGKSIGQIMEESCRLYDDADVIGYGMDENEALVNLAKKLNLPHWTQSPGPHDRIKPHTTT